MKIPNKIKIISTIVLILLTAGCDILPNVAEKSQKNAGNTGYEYTVLSVTNGSNTAVSDVRYAGGKANYSGSTFNPANPYEGTYVTILRPGEKCEFKIGDASASDSLHFTVGGKEVRTQAHITIEKGKKESFTLNDNTLVVYQGKTHALRDL